jgi:hypothetical protein
MQLKPPSSLSRTKLHSTNGMMGRKRRKDGNHSSQKNNSIQDSVGNEENGYPVPDPNKSMTNVTKEPGDPVMPTHTQKKKT